MMRGCCDFVDPNDRNYTNYTKQTEKEALGGWEIIKKNEQPKDHDVIASNICENAVVITKAGLKLYGCNGASEAHEPLRLFCRNDRRYRSGKNQYIILGLGDIRSIVDKGNCIEKTVLSEKPITTRELVDWKKEFDELKLKAPNTTWYFTLKPKWNVDKQANILRLEPSEKFPEAGICYIKCRTLGKRFVLEAECRRRIVESGKDTIWLSQEEVEPSPFLSSYFWEAEEMLPAQPRRSIPHEIGCGIVYPSFGGVDCLGILRVLGRPWYR
jgi:hypothetical protein